MNFLGKFFLKEKDFWKASIIQGCGLVLNFSLYLLTFCNGAHVSLMGFVFKKDSIERFTYCWPICLSYPNLYKNTVKPTQDNHLLHYLKVVNLYRWLSYKTPWFFSSTVNVLLVNKSSCEWKFAIHCVLVPFLKIWNVYKI